MNHQIKLKPFMTPNFALAEGKPGLRQDGFIQATSYPIQELSDETLEAMCKQFRDDVFAKKEMRK